MSDSANEVPQGGTPKRDYTPVVAEGVHLRKDSAGSMDFGGSQDHDDARVKETKLPGLPFLMVEGRPLARSGSNRSLASIRSCGSAFSNASAQEDEDANEERDKASHLRAEEFKLIEQMEDELQKLLDVLPAQRTVSLVIQTGLKSLSKLITEAKKKHEAAEESERVFHKFLKWNQETRDSRKKIREKVQARVIKNIVLQQERTKRVLEDRSPPHEKDPKKIRRNETFAEKARAPKKKVSQTAQGAKMPRTTVSQPRSATMILQVSDGKTYADVLSKLRSEVNPEECEASVVCARPTRKGNLLLKLGKESNKAAFSAKVSAVVQGLAKVRTQEDQRVSLEIRDLDGLTEPEDVVVAIDKIFGAPNAERKVKLFSANKRGVKLAVVTTTEEEAAMMEQLGRVRVGFVSCHVKRRVVVTRCYRCLGYGHHSTQCTGVDRSASCFNCGSSDHVRANCTGEASCFLCQENGTDSKHQAGSGKCRAFKEALEIARKRKANRRQEAERQ